QRASAGAESGRRVAGWKGNDPGDADRGVPARLREGVLHADAKRQVGETAPRPELGAVGGAREAGVRAEHEPLARLELEQPAERAGPPQPSEGVTRTGPTAPLTRSPLPPHSPGLVARMPLVRTPPHIIPIDVRVYHPPEQLRDEPSSRGVARLAAGDRAGGTEAHAAVGVLLRPQLPRPARREADVVVLVPVRHGGRDAFVEFVERGALRRRVPRA